MNLEVLFINILRLELINFNYLLLKWQKNLILPYYINKLKNYNVWILNTFQLF